jgi:hypothetical protein
MQFIRPAVDWKQLNLVATQLTNTSTAAFVGVEVTRLISISDWRLRIADFSE